MTPQDTAVLVLAAGLSRRFGDGDKLLAPVRGQPLAAHVAATVAKAPFADRFAVVPAGNQARASIFAAAGFQVIENAQPARGQGRSLALGAQNVCGTPAGGLLVLLADMPFVRLAHLLTLLERIGEAPAAASLHGARRIPPTLFARQAFADLSALDGDAGARSVLGRLDPVVEVPMAPEAAVDIDTAADLEDSDRT